MNDQLKLTLASGVVHGLKCRVKGRDEILTIIGYDNHLNSVRVKIGEYAFYTRVDDIDILMHHTSKLTSPILPDGKIPIVELAKMAFPEYEWYLEEDYASFGINDFAYDSELKSFVFEDFDGAVNIPNQLVLFDQLDAWHINYRGVEAVEIETDY